MRGEKKPTYAAHEEREPNGKCQRGEQARTVVLTSILFFVLDLQAESKARQWPALNKAEVHCNG